MQGIQIAVLDDYQAVGRSLADWASLEPRGRAVFFQVVLRPSAWRKH